MTDDHNREYSDNPDEMELFERESLLAIGRVKKQLRREKQVRRTAQIWVAVLILLLILGDMMFPGSIDAMRNWISSITNVPFRHALPSSSEGQGIDLYQPCLAGVVFSTGGRPYSHGQTRRWLDDYKEFELVDDEWVLRFSDDFESDSHGALPSGWEASLQLLPGTDLFIDSAGPDRNNLDLGNSIAFIDLETDNFGAMISRSFDQSYCDSVAIEWSQRHEAKEDTLRIEINANVNIQPFSVGMKGNDPDHSFENGWIFAATEAEETLLVMEWEPNRWYRFRLEIDVPEQTYSLFIDGDEVYSDK